MSATAIEVINTALYRVGAEAIQAVTDANDRARVCNSLYGQVRDATMRGHPWNCLKARASIAADATAPAFGYTYRYPLPTDPYCLRVLKTGNKKDLYKLEGRYILTDEAAPLSLLYVGRITDVAQWDAELENAIALRLAAEICVPLRGEQAKGRASDLLQLYAAVIKEAKFVNGMETSHDPLISSGLIDVRGAGSNDNTRVGA
jgi:hypothetical protein